jgi:hypothetical protein
MKLRASLVPFGALSENSPPCSDMHVQQCLSLKSKRHDATTDKNGETAAPSNKLRGCCG